MGKQLEAMGTAPTNPVSDLTASDVLSSPSWIRRSPRPVLGLDVTCTKIAVDFQNMAETGADATIRQNLEALREATATDATFIALYDADTASIESVSVSKNLFAQCNPEVLKGEPLEGLPWLRNRLEHMRILEVRDTANARREHAAEAARLAQLNIGSLLLIGFAIQGRVSGFLGLCGVQPREGWDVNLHLLLKLIGTSFARSGAPVAAGHGAWPAYGAERAYMAFENSPVPRKNLLPGMYELNEEVVCRRRAKGGIRWHWNVGLASPPLPPEAPQCR